MLHIRCTVLVFEHRFALERNAIGIQFGVEVEAAPLTMNSCHHTLNKLKDDCRHYQRPHQE
jgi:hypothetical protein